MYQFLILSLLRTFRVKELSWGTKANLYIIKSWIFKLNNRMDISKHCLASHTDAFRKLSIYTINSYIYCAAKLQKENCNRAALDFGWIVLQLINAIFTFAFISCDNAFFGCSVCICNLCIKCPDWFMIRQSGTHYLSKKLLRH